MRLVETLPVTVHYILDVLPGVAATVEGVGELLVVSDRVYLVRGAFAARPWPSVSPPMALCRVLPASWLTWST